MKNDHPVEMRRSRFKTRTMRMAIVPFGRPTWPVNALGADLARFDFRPKTHFFLRTLPLMVPINRLDNQRLTNLSPG